MQFAPKTEIRSEIPRSIQTACALLLISIIVAGAATADSNRDHHRNLQKLMRQLSEHTNKNTAAGAAASLLVLGREKEFETGQMLVLALAGSSTITAALKYAFNRSRPTPPTIRKNSSFPSGHATAAFAGASVLARSYPRLAVPAYVLAGGVAYSRLYLRRHYGSDVIAGAVIGILAAHWTEKHKNRLTIRGRGLLGAILTREHRGFYIAYSF